MRFRCAFSPSSLGKAQLSLAAFALALLLAATGAGAAPPAQTTVHDVEDEVMCPVCGTLLELADSPQARREKVLVAKLVDEGKSKDEVKDTLVAQYGDEVLAQPDPSGFDLSAYLVPILAILIAAVVLAYSVLRWRRSEKEERGPAGGAAQPPRGEEAERLEADLSRYDL